MVPREVTTHAEAYIVGEIAIGELVERTKKRWAIHREAGSRDEGAF